MIEAPIITKGEALAIHAAAIIMFGGVEGTRDEGLLDSALAQPFHSFDGIALYPSAEEKACRYAFGVIKNHPFVDGNKRTAAALLGTFLRRSGIDFQPLPTELLAAICNVADSSWDFTDLVNWVCATIA